MFLPLRKAVKTSVLSRQWKNKWVYLPAFVFDHSFNVPATTTEPANDATNKTLSDVLHVLELHQGSLQGLALRIPQLRRFPREINEILQALDNTCIKSLSIAIEGYNLPSCIFSFGRLNKLHLCSCSITRSVIAFDSLTLLAVLELREVRLSKNVKVAFRFDSDALEDLTMDSCGDRNNKIRIVIEAPIHC
ncbi:F-box/FBD/LRR-repeat protein At1g13570 [Linum perenne]